MADESKDYPRMLYRQADAGTEHESAPGADDGIVCQHRTVENAEEEEAAKAEGWANSPAEAADAADAAAPAKKGSK